jgi:hypothetical protein
MARFLKLTDAHPDRMGKPIAINIDSIVAIREHQIHPDTPNADKMRTIIITDASAKGFVVQETFEKITNSLPN